MLRCAPWLCAHALRSQWVALTHELNQPYMEKAGDRLALQALSLLGPPSPETVCITPRKDKQRVAQKHWVEVLLQGRHWSKSWTSSGSKYGSKGDPYAVKAMATIVAAIALESPASL